MFDSQQVRDIFLFSKLSRPALGPIQPLFNGRRGFFPSEVGLTTSSLFRTEVKNNRCYAFISLKKNRTKFWSNFFYNCY